MPPKQAGRSERQQPKPQSTNQPAATIRHGNLKLTLWRNEGDNGPWYAASLVRTFRTESGFQEASSVSADDLLRVAFLAQQAYGQFLALKAQDKAALQDGPDDAPVPY